MVEATPGTANSGEEMVEAIPGIVNGGEAKKKKTTASYHLT